MMRLRNVLRRRRTTLDDLQQALGYRFRRPLLLEQSLTHRSFTHETANAAISNNERLEFLGDAVLDLVISHMLLERYTNNSEGFLSKCLASMVNESSLAQIAKTLDLGRHLRLGRGEDNSRGREKPSILADALEAVIAAVYIDGGLKNAKAVIRLLFAKWIDGEIEFSDYKTQLQEFTQQRLRCAPSYRVVRQSGKEHEREFEIAVLVQGESLGVGTGRTKKEAEQQAAKEALVKLKNSDLPVKPKRKAKPPVTVKSEEIS